MSDTDLLCVWAASLQSQPFGPERAFMTDGLYTLCKHCIKPKSEIVSRSIMSDSLRPHGL